MVILHRLKSLIVFILVIVMQRNKKHFSTFGNFLDSITKFCKCFVDFKSDLKSQYSVFCRKLEFHLTIADLQNSLNKMRKSIQLFKNLKFPCTIIDTGGFSNFGCCVSPIFYSILISIFINYSKPEIRLCLLILRSFRIFSSISIKGLPKYESQSVQQTYHQGSQQFN